MPEGPVQKDAFLYGPVPSRRLGLSLGVDIIPPKVCTLDCIYCQLGRTTSLSIERKPYIEPELVLAELKQRLAAGLKADFITLGGSGEPTLNSTLGRLIDGVRFLTEIPVAILTNGTLMYRPDVRADCANADVVLPSLDAAAEQVFQKINRPHPDINVEMVISGLVAFRAEFSGQIWLEILFTAGVNDGPDHLAKLREAIEVIQPDKVHVNTVVRPPAEQAAQALDASGLQTIARRLGPGSEVIAEFSAGHCARSKMATPKDVLSVLRRRPCSVDDICSALEIDHLQAQTHLRLLLDEGSISRTDRFGKTFYGPRE